MSDNYDLKELAKLLNFTTPYCRMVLRSMGHNPTEPVPADIAAQLASKLSRPWPPEA